MDDYKTDEVLGLYTQQSEQQIIDLNKTIVALRTKVAYLEKQIQEYEKVPVPRTVIDQILQLEAKNRKLEADIAHYKKFVPVQVIINKENKEKPTRKGGIPR
jgi:septal ring factor EnvC (AmiA/AmiB activator)